MPHTKRHKQVKLLRFFRKTHKVIGLTFLVFMLFVSITGILLALKKHSGELLMPKTYTGISTELKDWLPIDSLHRRAIQVLHDSVSKDLSPELSKIDIRPKKGTAKFIFDDHYGEIQLDGATGELLNIGVRRADFIEHLHDGSILDRYFKTSGGQFKLFYSILVGLSLLLLSLSGLWLWYGPKKLRRLKLKSQKNLKKKQ